MQYLNAAPPRRKADGDKKWTKAELRRHIAAHGDATVLPLTSVRGPSCIGLGSLDEDTCLSVCGPDPYTDRRWFATVRRVGGKLVVT